MCVEIDIWVPIGDRDVCKHMQSASECGCRCGHTCGHQRRSSGILGALFTLSFETGNSQSKLGRLATDSPAPGTSTYHWAGFFFF